MIKKALPGRGGGMVVIGLFYNPMIQVLILLASNFLYCIKTTKINQKEVRVGPMKKLCHDN